MTKLTVRILLFLAVLALCRIVVDGLQHSDGPKEVLVVLVSGGNCAASVETPENAGEN